MKNILFVCTGNTCRSPMAEYYFNHKMKNNEYAARSCGIAAHGSGCMSKYAAQIIKMYIPESETGLFRSRQVDEGMIAEAYRMYGITKRHAEYLKENFHQYQNKIFAMPNDISDPFNGSLDTYKKAYEDIKIAVDAIIKELLTCEFTIVPMTAESLASVCEIERESFSDPWTPGMFEEILSGEYALNGCAVFVTIQTQESKVAGYAGFYKVGGELQIQNVAVAKKFRNSGFASHLLTYIIEYAKKNFISVLTLEVRESNVAARSLYEKFGFKEVGVRKNYYRLPRENAVLMDYTV